MRQQFVDCKSRKTAWRRCPWAAAIIKVEGGFLAFESLDDWQTWDRQK